jgi:hypothetical protein
MDPISDSASIDLAIHVLIAGDFDEDQKRVALSIADFSREANVVESLD